MLQQVLDRRGALQLVREVLSMLEVKDAARVELHFAENGVLDFLRVEDHVHVQIIGAFTLVDLYVGWGAVST